jgi:hypothetical protein
MACVGHTGKSYQEATGVELWGGVKEVDANSIAARGKMGREKKGNLQNDQ